MNKRLFWSVITLLTVAMMASFYHHKTGVEEFQWVRYWDEIDIDVIKRDYQPFTLAEMQEMWSDELIIKSGGSERFVQSIGKAVDVYPQNTFLARMLELGRPFVDFSDYEDALTNQRITLYSTRVHWESMSAAERATYLEQRGLPPDATWEHYEEVLLKDEVVHSINFRLSIEQDPYMNGPISGWKTLMCPLKEF